MATVGFHVLGSAARNAGKARIGHLQAPSSGGEPCPQEGRGGVAFEPATNSVCDKYLARRIVRIGWLYSFNLFKLIFGLPDAYIVVILCRRCLISTYLLLMPWGWYY